MFPGMRSISDPPLWLQALAFLTGFAHQAVVLFFVLSGWLVGGSLLEKFRRPLAYEHYAIDRISRLWTVLLPCLLLSAVLAGQLPDWPVLLGNLFGWQTLVVPAFGGNFPLWSLVNETAYYAMFPLLLAAATATSSARRWLAAGLVSLWLGLAPAALSLYFLVWLIGAAASRLRLPAAAGLAVPAWLGFAALAAYLRLRGWNDDLDLRSIGQDLLYGAMFGLCLALLPGGARRGLTPRLAESAAGLAAFSFTLYVMHMPLLWALQPAPLDPYATTSLLHYLQWLAAIVFGSSLCYAAFEAHTGAVRAWLKRRLLPEA
ncbi:acyltransferase family protein [Massilia sp. TS11]|nr:acyltransferase family protein [Massilia sp. TS11]